MAQFAPYTGDQQAPSYIGLSKEPGPIKPNTALGTLFSGVGDLFGEGIKAKDELVKDKAKDEAYKGVDPVIREDIGRMEGILGVGDTPSPANPAATPKPIDQNSNATNQVTSGASSLLTNQPTVNPSDVPPDVKAGVKDIQTLATAKNYSKLNNANFQGRIDEITSNLLSRYPGYRSTIEGAMDQAVNARGGAYRNKLETLVQASLTQQDDGKKQWQTEMHADREILGTRYPEAVAAFGNPDKMAYFRSMTGDLRASQYQAEMHRKSIEDAKKAGDLTEDNTIRGVSKVYQEVYTGLAKATQYDLASGGSGQFHQTLNDLHDRIIKLQGQPEPVRKQELADIGTALGQIRNVLVMKLDQEDNRLRYNEQADGTFKDSISSLVKDKAKLAEARKPVLDSFDAIAKHVGEGNLTLASNAFNTVAGMQDMNSVDLLRSNTAMQTLSAVNGVLPNQSGAISVNTILEASNKGDGKGGLLGEVTRGVSNFRPIQSITALRAQEIAGQGKGSLSDSLTDYKGATMKVGTLPANPPPEFMKKQIDITREMVLSKDAPPQMKANVAKVIANEGTTDFLLSFKPDQQFNAWARLATPEVNAEIKKLGPEVWNTHRDAMETTFKRLFTKYIASTNEGFNSDLKNYNIKLNDKGTLDYTPLLQGKPMDNPRLGGALGTSVPFANKDSVTYSIDRLNVGLQTLQGVLDQDGIKITPEYLRRLGIEKQSEGPNNGIGQTIINALLLKDVGVADKSNTPDMFLKHPDKAIQEAGNPDKVSALPYDQIKGSANAAKADEVWGNPLDTNFTKDHLTTIQTANGQTAKVNKVAAEAFQGFVDELQGMGYNIGSIGGYNLRAKKGSDSISQHAFGNAIDINPDTNPYSRLTGGKMKTDLPPNVGEIAAKYGLTWGGDWKSIKDPMHFEFTGANSKLPKNASLNQGEVPDRLNPGVVDSHFQEATKALDLDPKEQALYKMHLQNLNSDGGVDNADGSRSTLFQAVEPHNGKFYNIPTVWNGKIETEKWTRPSDGKVFDIPNKTALANVAKIGWDKFPSYKTAEEADARYEDMHKFMDKDTGDFLSKKNTRQGF